MLCGNQEKPVATYMYMKSMETYEYVCMHIRVHTHTHHLLQVLFLHCISFKYNEQLNIACSHILICAGHHPPHPTDDACNRVDGN